MSTIDQAFVQAFSRKNRSTAATPAAPVQPPIDDGLQLDPSVAESAQVWVDPIENTLLRADQPSGSSLSGPHYDTTSAPPETQTARATELTHASQHLHTAYVFADGSATPIAPAPLAPASTPQNPVDSTPIPSHRIDSPVESIQAHVAPTAPHAPSETEQPSEPTETVTDSDDAAVSEDAVAQEAISEKAVLQEVIAEDAVTEDAATEDAVVQETVAEKVSEPMLAVWEVDAFDVPSSVADLFFEEKLFQQVAKRMHAAVAEGLQSVVVTSAKSGEGRSTVAIGMAVAAAAAGLNVALVDGDIDDPTLADDLRLEVEYGWADTLRGGVEMEQVAVYSIEDGVTFLPLMPTNINGVSDAEISKLIHSLNNRFDLVIIDGPTGDLAQLEKYASLVDSAIIAWDKSRTDIDTINELSYRMHESGISGVGIVENFS